MHQRLLAAGLLALAAPHAAAQVRDTLPRDSLRPVPLAPVVATATRLPLRPDQLGVALSVLDSLQLRAEPPRFAADALRRVPGAFVEEANGPGGPAIVRLRGGEEVFTQVLIDGVKVNQNGGYFDLQGVTLGNVDRVEVAPGPGSALYGSSAVSGVVQVVSRAGRPGPLRLRGDWEGGVATEHGAGYRGTVALDGGTAAVRVSADAGTTYDRGIFSIANDRRVHEAGLRVDAEPSARWSLGATARWMDAEGHLPVRDGGATRLPLDPNAFNARSRGVGSASARVRHGDGWSQELRTTLYREGFTYTDERDGVSHPDFFVFDADFRLESTLWRGTVEYVGRVERTDGAGTATRGLSWGAQCERETLHDVTSGDFGAGDQTLDRNALAAFAEGFVEVGPVSLLAGARAERYEEMDTEVTPRATAVWRAVPGVLSLRAAVGRAFKAPNLQEQYLDNPFIVANPDLAPERSTSWEVGADASRGAASFRLTLFRQDFRDLIRSVPDDDPDSEKSINRNLGRSRAQGVELGAQVTPASWWMGGVDAAFLSTEVLDNRGQSADLFPEGEALPGRPERVGSAWVEVQPAARWRVRLRGTHVGPQTVFTERFSGQRVEVDPYTLASLNVQFDAARRWTAYLRVDNLFDHAHQVGFDRPGQPLTASLGVRLR